jgi:D-fructose-responsive transcription factor
MIFSIQQIADKAGVSKTTVSLVINGKARAHRINPETEKRILELVRVHNFTPNKSARRFRTNKSETMGLIVPDVTNPFFSRLCLSLEQALKQNGYQMLIGCSDDQVETEQKVMRNLLSYSVDALIIASTMNTQELLLNLKHISVPAVFIDREILSEKISSVSSDNYLGAFSAMNHLCSLGVQEVFHIGGLEELSTTRERLKGYADAVKLYKIESRVYLKDYSSASGYGMMKEVLKTNGKIPQAIFTGSYTLLEGTLQCIRDEFKSIPHDFRIATFDDHPLLDYIPNRIISIRQNTDNMAAAAFELIMNQLVGSVQVEHRKIAPELIVRE